jgi:16S rRNA (guanine1207-N2)-methyltransferase
MPVSSLLIQPPYDTEPEDWGATLLAQWAASTVAPGTRVLIVGAGAGGIGLPLTRAGAAVTFADDHVAALAAARQSFAQARLKAEFVTTLELAPEQPFDLALLNILWWTDAARGAELIALAALHTRPGGIVAVAGGKDAGIGAAERDLKAVVGPAAPVV